MMSVQTHRKRLQINEKQKNITIFGPRAIASALTTVTIPPPGAASGLLQRMVRSGVPKTPMYAGLNVLSGNGRRDYIQSG